MLYLFCEEKTKLFYSAHVTAFIRKSLIVIRVHLANGLVYSGQFRSTMNFYKTHFKKTTHIYQHPPCPHNGSYHAEKESTGKTKKPNNLIS